MENTAINSYIPIVLATDKNGISLLYTTILSAIKNKNKSTNYIFYCLIQNKFSKYVYKQFQKLTKKYKGVDIKFINMKDDFRDQKMQIEHISSPTYYRLKLAEVFPQYDKVIYLDIDTIVLQDLTELYETDMGNNYIGGVHTVGYKILMPDYCNKLNIPDLECYINAGIILWNLKLIRQDNMTEKLLDLSKNTYKYMDQDIINIAFYNRIKHLDFKYNLMVSYKIRILAEEDKLEVLYAKYGKDGIEKAIKSPAIVHYASEKKPWNTKGVWLGEYWQKYGIKSPFKTVPVNKCSLDEKFLKQVESIRYRKIVFWGASLFLEDIIKTQKMPYTNILGIIDMDKSKHGMKIGKYTIYSPDDISKLNPGVVILSVKHNSNKVYESVKSFLQTSYPDITLMPNIF